MPQRVTIEFKVIGFEKATEAFRKLGDAMKELSERMKANTIAIPPAADLMDELLSWSPVRLDGIKTREEAERRARELLRRDY